MRTIVFCLVLFASSASAQQDHQTRILVPGGSATFPTLGEVHCLEESGSGRYCAATWECGDDRGDLWGEMDDGPRTVDPTSPVSTKTGCAIVVDGEASARWFTGYAVASESSTRTVVSVTANHEAETPVVHRIVESSGDAGLLLDWLYEEHGISPQSIYSADCGHIRDGDEYADERRRCWRDSVDQLRLLVNVASNERTQCVANVEMSFAAEPTGRDLDVLGQHIYLLVERIMHDDDHDCSSWTHLSECCTLYKAELERLGVLAPPWLE